MKINLKLKLLSASVLLGLLIQPTYATLPRPVPKIEDFKEIQKNLRNSSLPVTFVDKSGKSIVSLHLIYGLEEQAYNYIKNAQKEVFNKLKTDEIFYDAIKNGSQRVVKLLLEMGYPTNKSDIDAKVFIAALQSEKQMAMFYHLIENKFSLEMAGNNREFAQRLMSTGNLNLVYCALSFNFDLTTYLKMPDQGELFFYAVDSKSVDLVDALSNWGFNGNITNKAGEILSIYTLRQYVDDPKFSMNAVDMLMAIARSQNFNSKQKNINGETYTDVFKELKTQYMNPYLFERGDIEKMPKIFLNQ
jgi:hypothetical protein